MESDLKEKFEKLLEEISELKHRVNLLETEQNSTKMEQILTDFRLKMLE